MAGRQGERTGWGGLLAVTKLQDEDQVSRGRRVSNQLEVRGRQDRNEIITF